MIREKQSEVTFKTRKALKGSIAKWKAILNGTGTDQGLHNCPLCEVFSADNCEGCPVALDTGSTACDKTPYEDWARHHSENHQSGGATWNQKIECDVCGRYAEAELEYLKDLKNEIDRRRENRQQRDAP